MPMAAQAPHTLMANDKMQTSRHTLTPHAQMHTTAAQPAQHTPHARTWHRHQADLPRSQPEEGQASTQQPRIQNKPHRPRPNHPQTP